jgi:hypothetical protein
MRIGRMAMAKSPAKKELPLDMVFDRAGSTAEQGCAGREKNIM